MIRITIYRNWNEALRSEWRDSIRKWPDTKQVKNKGPICQVAILECSQKGLKTTKVVTVVTLEKYRNVKNILPLIGEGLEKIVRKVPNAIVE